MTIINFPGYYAKYLWWIVDGLSPSDARAVWIAKGAPNLATSLVDQTGNGNNLTGANPTFNSSIGWTSRVLFSSINNLAAPPYTIVWKGNFVSGTNLESTSFFLNSTNSWNGIVGHAYVDNNIYVGHGTDASGRFSRNMSNYTNVRTIVYQKYGAGDSRHSLWVDGSLIGTQSQPAPTNFTFRLGTGSNNCAGALIFGKILTSAQISEILNRFNSK